MQNNTGKHGMTGEVEGRELVACSIDILWSARSEGTGSSMARGGYDRDVDQGCQEKFLSLVIVCMEIAATVRICPI